ncbi:MAG: hypothetical protein IJJ96_00485 [Bacteroidales bacterium]|nr:hypothetical protein [Bacteroidales bacterium]
MRPFVKGLIITCLALLAGMSRAEAQIFPRVRPSVTSESQNMVVSAMKDALCVMRLKYQLEDTLSHEKFNVEDKDFFGVAEGFCVKTKGGWIAPVNVATPWFGNNDVKKFPGMTPVISSSEILSPGDSVFKPTTVPIIKTHKQIPMTSYEVVEVSSDVSEGLMVGGWSEKVDGFVVWLSKKENILSINAYGQHADSTIVSMTGKTAPEGAIGGVFIKPTYPSAGTIHFEILGFLDNGPEGWRIIMIDNPIETPVLSEDKPKLVPATPKQEKKTKKTNKK